MLDLEGSFYQRPLRRQPVIAIPPDWGGFNMVLTAPGLTGQVPPGEALKCSLLLTNASEFRFVLVTPEKPFLVLHAGNGLVTGRFFDTVARETRRLQGVVLQSQQRIGGYFVEGQEAGTFDVTPIFP